MKASGASFGTSRGSRRKRGSTALYCVDNQFNYDEALGWIDRAIADNEESFGNLDLKSQILEKLGRRQEADGTLAKALTLATPEQMYRYGDRLLREKKLDQSRQVFAKQTVEHPAAWRGWYGLARVQAAQGDRASAKKSLEEALSRASQPAQKAGIQRLARSPGRGSRYRMT